MISFRSLLSAYRTTLYYLIIVSFTFVMEIGFVTRFLGSDLISPNFELSVDIKWNISTLLVTWPFLNQLIFSDEQKPF